MRDRGNEGTGRRVSSRGRASEIEKERARPARVGQSRGVGDEVTDTGVRDRVTRRETERER